MWANFMLVFKRHVIIIRTNSKIKDIYQTENINDLLNEPAWILFEADNWWKKKIQIPTYQAESFIVQKNAANMLLILEKH